MMKKPFLLLTTALLLVFGMSSKLYAQDDLIRTLGMGSLECIAYSPDGTKLVSAGHSGYIYIWDINSGEVIDTLKGHNSRVYSVAFSPDGTKLASGGSDKTIKLWDVNTGALIRTFEGHTNWVNSVAFSPDGSMLASGSSDGTIRIWRIPPPTSVESDFNNKNELIAFPNPFSESTSINYELQTAGRVRIDIFNSLGEKITTLVDEWQEAGRHSEEFRITNYELPAGMYYYRIQIGERIESGKMMLIR